MLKKFLTLSLPALVIAATSTAAVATEKYPAANFSPSVIYIDESYSAADDKSTTNTTRKTSKADPKYPAANFSPSVIYLDESSVTSSNSSSTSNRETSKADPKYPAANFSPTVTYFDGNTEKKKQLITKQPTKEIKNTQKTNEKKEESGLDLLYFFPLFALIGFFLLLKKKQTIIDLSQNVKQCQASTIHGTRCKRRLHLETASIIANEKTYQLMVCKQHKSHFSKPFVRLP